MGPLSSPTERVVDALEGLKVDEPRFGVAEPHSLGQDGNVSDSSSGDDFVGDNAHEVTPDSGVFYSTNGYATETGYTYDNLNGGEHEEYPCYVGLGRVDPAVYAEDGSAVYHPGYAYASHPDGAYFPGQFYAIVTDGQVYGHPYNFSGAVYAQYPVVDGGYNALGGGNKRLANPVAVVSPQGSYPRGVTATQAPRKNSRSKFTGLRATAPAWIDTRPNNQPQVSESQAHSQAAQPAKSTDAPTLPGALGTAFPPLTRAVLTANAAGRGRGADNNGADSASTLKGRGKIAGNNSDEQSKGLKTKTRFQRLVPSIYKQPSGQLAEADSRSMSTIAREQFNRPEFTTFYEDAKFFVIKSYGEDDVHKSIKYGVWASTPNGNKRLDAAYREAQQKNGGRDCPVFLFFSVNASGHFCGVAEMTGPVDFVKNMDFWKWSGCFAVKWHLVKDLPNGHLRHIILENNENRPVTHSRDTQEVKFSQGIQMLKIFKSYSCSTSILNDFHYYDSREKAMREKRAKQERSQQQWLDECSKPPQLVNGHREKLMNPLAEAAPVQKVEVDVKAA